MIVKYDVLWNSGQADDKIPQYAWFDRTLEHE